MKTSVPTHSKTSRTFRNVLSVATGKREYVQDLAGKYDSGLSALTERRKWLLPAFIAGLIATMIVWIIALSFPFAVSKIYSLGVNSDLPSRYSNFLSVLLMSIPFAPPFLSGFALGNLLFPAASDTDIASGVMSSFAYKENSSRRRLIFVAAGMCGAANCLVLVVAVSSATGH